MQSEDKSPSEFLFSCLEEQKETKKGTNVNTKKETNVKVFSDNKTIHQSEKAVRDASTLQSSSSVCESSRNYDYLNLPSGNTKLSSGGNISDLFYSRLEKQNEKKKNESCVESPSLNIIRKRDSRSSMDMQGNLYTNDLKQQKKEANDNATGNLDLEKETLVGGAKKKKCESKNFTLENLSGDNKGSVKNIDITKASNVYKMHQKENTKGEKTAYVSDLLYRSLEHKGAAKNIDNTESFNKTKHNMREHREEMNTLNQEQNECGKYGLKSNRNKCKNPSDFLHSCLDKSKATSQDSTCKKESVLNKSESQDQRKCRKPNQREQLSSGGTSSNYSKPLPETGNVSKHSQKDKNVKDTKRFDSSKEKNKKKGNNNEDQLKDDIPFSIIGYKRLEELVNSTASELVIALANQYIGFETRLKENLSPDWIMLIVKALSKVCEADFQENKSSILSHACEMDFLIQVAGYLMKLPFEKHPIRKANILDFINNLLKFYESVLNLLPTKACDVLEKMLDTTERSVTCVEACQNMKFTADVKEKILDLNCRLKVRMGEQELMHTNKNVTNRLTQDETPPNDFRTLTVYPTPDDILSGEKPFIRPNIVKGAYSTVEHYLDIQFRLLREDFVCPLREAITEYICNAEAGNRKKKFNNVRIYHKANFVNPIVLKDKVGLLVCFDPEERLRKRINWDTSRRFMFGSLLCFSKDNFTTVFFGTVAERNISQLKQGLVTVMLKDAGDITDNLFSTEFILVESEVYFEPYYHVLNALQHMTADDFPMKNYIVDVESTSKPPQYITASPNFHYHIDGHMVLVTDDYYWPSPQQLDLDDSQYRAFKSALTKEFVVIQGPPGTGKTYIGLKIVKVLLDNAPIWNASQKPILVVCYTNHALDQFLEGLLPYTQQLVRIGGQSKSEILSKFNLREKQRSVPLPGNIRYLFRNIRDRINSAMFTLKKVQIDMEKIQSCDGVISLEALQTGNISLDHLRAFRQDDEPVNEQLFLEWLRLGFETFKQNNDTSIIEQEVPEYVEDVPEDDVDDGIASVNMQAPEDLLDFDFDFSNITSHIAFALDFKKLERDLEWLEIQLSDLQEQNMDNPNPTRKEIELACQYEELQLNLKYFKTCVKQTHRSHRRKIEELLEQRNLWQLQAADRWILYNYWVNQLLLKLSKDLRQLEELVRQQTKLFEEAKQMGYLEVMKKSLVIGMTTTGAARLQPLLRALKPRIVIVEEAAEVMESHIVVSLTSHCQHLILIGDHQQLRPTTAVYRLAKDYSFDISLFERMLKNGMHCETLKVQHRMRPEVARLIVPTIYPELLNHPSVETYGHITGVLKNVFFITHNHPEEEVSDTESRKNIHEAKFLMAFARHLVLQGYSPQQITILTTYSGQMFFLRKLRSSINILKGTRISVVDNFQGEENDIILLSLVRSNCEAKIGFLKIENRVCVSLSRAKMGFYIIGNMNNLTKSSSIWPKIKASLEEQEAIDNFLTLRCQIHTAHFTRVSTDDDFHQVPEGGCSLPCDSEMPCGHKCRSVCHILNREHNDYKCLEPCSRVPKQCIYEHKCRKLCWEDCGRCTTKIDRILACGHSQNFACFIDPNSFKCPVLIEVELECGHKVQKPCHEDIKTYPCSHFCEYRLPCGHKCENKCHIKSDPDHLEYKCYKPCAKKNEGCTQNHLCQKRCYDSCEFCLIEVDKKLPGCGHVHKVACSKNPATVICQRKCKRKLQCGHPCPLTCDKPCGGCQVKVKKVIPDCGHTVNLKCCEDPIRRMCKLPCNRKLVCGHKCTNSCGVPCTDQCNELVVSSVRAACRHAVYVPCYRRNFQFNPLSQELMSYCQVPCNVLLECGHPCKGTCGECLQGRIHKACSERCGRPLICGHVCSIPCSQSCPPCNKNCTFRCKHSKCKKKCGEPCTPCQEPCITNCIHKRCNKPCYKMCSIDPCTEPCPKSLSCGHMCIGFCGDKCPPLCRICDKEQVTEIFFGYEEEENARFIYLEDCKHVLESQGLEGWMSQTDGQIMMKECPRCKTPILQTQRFMNIIKTIYNDIAQVKNKIFGDLQKIEENRSLLQHQLGLLPPPVEFGTLLYEKLYNKLENELHVVRLEAQTKRKNVLSNSDIETLRTQISILSILTQMVMEIKWKLSNEAMKKLLTAMDVLLDVLLKRGKKISNQEVDDFSLESKRFKRCCELALLESEPAFKSMANDPKILASHKNVCDIANCIEKYSSEQDRKFLTSLEVLKKNLNSSVLMNDKLRIEIVRAMGLTQGHWYKCPNGHIYVITECGGAMEVGKCNECGAQIGGTQHRLLSSNSVASEMDGATRPAWPQ